MTETRAQRDTVEEADQGIDLIDLAVTFLVEWRLIAMCFVVTCVVGLISALVLPPQFEAKATMLPHASSSGSSDTEDPLAALFARPGPGAVYIGLMKSRSVEDEVIDRVHLMDLHHLKSRESARGLLTTMSSFTEGADTIVAITVRGRSAHEAATIANAYLDSLEDLDEKMDLQQATKRRKFYEDQLAQERVALSAAEEALAHTQQQTGLVQPQTQTASDLAAIAGARAEIDNRKVELAAMLQRETEQNPEVQTMRTQIAQLEANERELESSKGIRPVGAAVPAGQAPEANLDYQRKEREVTYHEARLSSLLNEYQNARLTEQQSTSAFQVVDRAVDPERKSWPPRRIFMLLAMAFGLIFGALGVVMKIIWRQMAESPDHEKHLARLRQSFHIDR